MASWSEPDFQNIERRREAVPEYRGVGLFDDDDFRALREGDGPQVGVPGVLDAGTVPTFAEVTAASPSLSAPAATSPAPLAATAADDDSHWAQEESAGLVPGGADQTGATSPRGAATHSPTSPLSDLLDPLREEIARLHDRIDALERKA